MMMKRILLSLLCLCSLAVGAQDWNKKKCAIVLTYDDALNVHLDQAIPALDSLQLKGSFYVIASSPAFTERMSEWKRAAARGHELGNHTLFHPCNGSLPGRAFVIPEYDLAHYSIRRISDELTMANTVLMALDGKHERTFAYPCGDTEAGGLSYLEVVKKNFVAARGVHPELLPNRATEVYAIGSIVVNGQSGDELIALVKEAMRTNSLLVFLFHGVGGEHSLNVSLAAHRQLLRYLKEQEKEIWNPTFIEAATYLKGTGAAAK